MTMREAKEKIYELVCEYFGNATVAWGKTKSVRPGSPLVSITTGNLTRTYHPVKNDIDGIPVFSYASSFPLQLDLFTKGTPVNDEDGVTAATENTAVSDLADFVNFLGSVHAEHWGMINDMAVLANTQIHDLTQLVNDSSWDYRAMVEIEVRFTETAVGYSAVNYEAGQKYNPETIKPIPDTPFVPSPSGGGTKELADEFTGYFEQVETEYEQEELINGE